MSCIPCTKVKQSERDIISYYKDIYKNTGKVYYVYRLSANDSIKIVDKSSFMSIFELQIKPNFEHGAEYFAIQEFKGN